jgi:hypothetical protein
MTEIRILHVDDERDIREVVLSFRLQLWLKRPEG